MRRVSATAPGPAGAGTAPVAVALTLLAFTFIPLGDAAGKLLTEVHGLSPGLVAWSRFALGALIVLPFLRDRGAALLLLGDWRVWLRAGLLAATILSVLTALSQAPMATVFGIFFLGPILSYGLGAWLLSERVGPARTALLLAGFGGVLLVVQPGASLPPGAGASVLAGLSYGAFLTASRWLQHRGSAGGMLFAQLLIGALLLAPLGLPALPDLAAREPEVAVGALLLASAVASMAGNLCLIAAYRRAPASRLAPFVYFKLVAATAVGWAVFGDWPGPVTLAGLGVLVASGLATLLLRPEAPRPPPG